MNFSSSVYCSASLQESLLLTASFYTIEQLDGKLYFAEKSVKNIVRVSFCNCVSLLLLSAAKYIRLAQSQFLSILDYNF